MKFNLNGNKAKTGNFVPKPVRRLVPTSIRHLGSGDDLSEYKQKVVSSRKHPRSQGQIVGTMALIVLSTAGAIIG